MSRELAVGLATVGGRIFFFGSHFGEGSAAPVRLEPGVPAEVPAAARLDEDLAHRLAVKEVGILAVPVGDTALRAGGAIEQRVGDRAEALATRRFEEPADEGSREVAELVEAERYILDDEAAVTAAARLFELEARDLFHRRGLDLEQLHGHAENRDAKDALGFDSLVWVRRDEDELLAIGHAGDSTQSAMARSERVRRTLKRSGAAICDRRCLTNSRIRRWTIMR